MSWRAGKAMREEDGDLIFYTILSDILRAKFSANTWLLYDDGVMA